MILCYFHKSYNRKERKMFPFYAVAKPLAKQAIKHLGLKALDSDGIKSVNPREDYAMKQYTNPNSPLYHNKEMIKEYYNPLLPLEKEIKDWNDDDLFNLMDSPLYKQDIQLKNKANEYIKHRNKKHVFF